jgi:hypothetical protein
VTSIAAQGGPLEKIGICHATGSQTNPFVYIEVPENALNGHEGHADDIIGVGSEADCVLPDDGDSAPLPDDGGETSGGVEVLSLPVTGAGSDNSSNLLPVLAAAAGLAAFGAPMTRCQTN